MEYKHLEKESRGVSSREKKLIKSVMKELIKKRSVIINKYIKKGEEAAKKELLGKREDIIEEFRKKGKMIAEKEIPIPEDILRLFVPLIKKIVKDYISYYPRRDYNELSQEGYIGLIYGLNKYDISHKTSPTTYVYPWIRNFIQRSIKTSNSMVKETAFYYSLFLYLKDKIIERKMSEEDVYKLFKPSKRGSNWRIPPDEAGLNHETIKKSTIDRHINIINKNIYQEKNYEMDFTNQYYKDEYSYGDKNDNGSQMLSGYYQEHTSGISSNSFGSCQSFNEKNYSFENSILDKPNSYFIKNKIYQILASTDMFTNEEKNLYLEYNELGSPQFLIQPDLFSETISFKFYNRQRKQFSKGIFFSKKYNISTNKVKHLMLDINDYFKSFFDQEEG